MSHLWRRGHAPWPLVSWLTLVALAFLLRDAPAHFLVVDDPREPVDAVVVLAGDPNYERTTYASGLLLSGQASWLVVTGGELGPGDSAASLRARALALGVPAEAILSEETSSGTWESLVNARPLLEKAGAKRVAVVTSPYHQRRASRAARRAWPGVQVLSWPAHPSFWSPEGWWRTAPSRRIVVEEWAKLLVYALRLRL